VSATGQSRKWEPVRVMSAFPLDADRSSSPGERPLGPEANIDGLRNALVDSADAVAGLIAGGLGDERPWWARDGARWWKSADVSVSWLDSIVSGDNDVRMGIFDVVKALYFPDNRRSSTAVGAADKTFDADDIGGSFTFSTSGGARTATLPAHTDVGDGYHLEMKGLSTANGIVLTPAAGDGIDGAADGATKTVPGGILFTVRWSAADDMWVTDYASEYSTRRPEDDAQDHGRYGLDHVGRRHDR
jgi:hypothetical protein